MTDRAYDIPKAEDENVLNLGLIQLKDHQGSLQILGGIPYVVQGGLSLGHFTGPVLKLGAPEHDAGLNFATGIGFERDGIKPRVGADLNLVNLVGGQAGVDASIGAKTGVHPHAGAFVGPFAAGGDGDVGVTSQGLAVRGDGGAGINTVGYQRTPIAGVSGGGNFSLGADTQINTYVAGQAGDARGTVGGYVRTHGDTTIDPNLYATGDYRNSHGSWQLNPPTQEMRMQPQMVRHDVVQRQELKEPYSPKAWEMRLNANMSYIADRTSITGGKNESWLDLAARIKPGSDSHTLHAEAKLLRELNSNIKCPRAGAKYLTIDMNTISELSRRETNAYFGLDQR